MAAFTFSSFGKISKVIFSRYSLVRINGGFVYNSISVSHKECSQTEIEVCFNELITLSTGTGSCPRATCVVISKDRIISRGLRISVFFL
jgi:hypothetical protein